MKIISLSIIIFMLFALPTKALDTKTLGKLTMVGILSATAFVVKMLVNRDQGAIDKLRESLGTPDRIIEFQKGFDHWRLEWYGENVYYFRNGFVCESPKSLIVIQAE